MRRGIRALAGGGLALLLLSGSALAVQQRNDVSFLRGKYNLEFFGRHRPAYRLGAAIHFAHAKQHDVLLLTPLERHEEEDRAFDTEMVRMAHSPPWTEPKMELFGPVTAQVAWHLYRAIDWTHMHHEQTYDVMSDRDIAWNEKAEWTRRSVRYYLDRFDLPRSAAPLDVTMRRAAVMMKPYFTLFRNNYPRSNDFFYVAHWWHPAVYEAQMIAGNDAEQDAAVRTVDALFFDPVLSARPQRMLLSREMMPRYARMSPESANIFDNLHMLHGIAYDILAYEGWTDAQKRAELERVLRAMSNQPGDEELARRFAIPRPDMDPRRYEPWMRGVDGSMTEIMQEMLEEMMPSMMPGGMSDELHARVMEQFRMKLTPGLQPGEKPGSLGEALQAVMPGMKMSPGSMAPGETAQAMVETMLAGWRRKHGDTPPVEPMPMEGEPALPLLLDEARRAQGTGAVKGEVR